MDISICGADCSSCDCKNQCEGCNALKGVPFHCNNNQECIIYNCCVSKHRYKNCLECALIPCDIWRKCRDPRYNDEEFEKNINERINTLNMLYNL